MSIKEACRTLAETITRGSSHRDRLEAIDTQIVITGTRGKSTLTRWVYETMYGRGHDVTAKITGNEPVSIHNGDVEEIEREGPRVTLYENVDEIRKHTPSDVLVLENQAISPHTTRLVHERFTDPDVVVLTNIREDHLSTLGRDRAAIARAFVRSIPEGTHVVNAERDGDLREFIARELEARGASVSNVTVPPKDDHVPGIESVYALNHILSSVGEQPLSAAELTAYRDEMRVQWTRLPDGLVFNAAEVNDVQSTELIRQTLCQRIDDPIQPFLFLRGDRRGRTVSFLRYLNDLYEREGTGAFVSVHVAGEGAEAFKRRAEFPVVVRDYERDDPADVLDRLFESDCPVMLMGNTVAEFMRELDDEIARREQIVTADQEEATADEPAVLGAPEQ